MNIKIIKDSDTPIYRQIIEQITRMIKSGDIKAGEKLPPERDLAEQLDIARGTIKKAYEELANDKIIEVTQGRGTFIAPGQEMMPEGRKEKAVRIIEDMLLSLEVMKFSYREIGNLIHLMMMEREKRLDNFHVAAIDCNPEALSVFERQLQYLTRIKIFKFMLDDVTKLADPEKKFREFDIILSTTTHYSELVGLLPTLKDKIIKAAVSPSQQTIIDLASISSSASIGIICESQEFLSIIRNKLESFQVDAGKISHIFKKDLEDLNSFLSDRTILIIPPDFPVETAREYVNAVLRFKEKGGRIIKFDYQIERGSLIYIEEQISNALSGK